MQNFSQTGAKKKPTVCSVRKVPPMQIMSRMWWMRRLLCLPVMMISTHSARKTPREKMTKHWADTDTISITSSSEKDSLWIINNAEIEEHKRAANVVLHFHPTLFANVRRKTIVTRAAVHTSNHGWNGRRGRRPNLRMRIQLEKLFCEESVCLISACSLEMAETLSMMREEEGRQKTGEGLENVWFINHEIFSVLISF